MGRIGIDVGGTFTDVVLEADDGTLYVEKVPTLPKALATGVMNGLEALATRAGVSGTEMLTSTRLIIHGTTVATNAVLTRSGATTAIVTTEGLRDALQMRRGIRAEPYNTKLAAPPTLVPRSYCIPVAERIGASGEIRKPLDAESLAEVVTKVPSDVTAIAVCLMHSYTNPKHERSVLAALRSHRPAAYLTASSDLLPQYRFYVRLSTTALNAYVGPVVNDYLKNLTAELNSSGFTGLLLVMQSNGGLASPSVVRQRPVATLLSGPAAAPAAGRLHLSAHGLDSAVTLDMGGTSTDLALLHAGQSLLLSEGVIDGHPIGLPMLAIHTIGAGGGSIAWIDPGGLLHMGPQSAGADPGPMCYGKGGTSCTATDANLVLGYLDPRRFMEGRMQLDSDAAHAGIRARVANPLGVTVTEAAAAMYDLMNVNTAAAVREVAITHGVDLTKLVLLVAGGAGPLHACKVAEEIDVRTIVIPSHSSVFCALGLLASDLKYDFVKSFRAPLAELDWRVVNDLRLTMARDGRELIEGHGVPLIGLSAAVALFMQYRGQFHEVAVSLAPELLATRAGSAVGDCFHKRHEELYGYALPDAAIEVTGIRTSVHGLTERPVLSRDTSPTYRRPKWSERVMVLPNRGSAAQVPVFLAEQLRPDWAISGPAVIEQRGATLLLLDRWTARVDEVGTIVMTAEPR